MLGRRLQGMGGSNPYSPDCTTGWLDHRILTRNPKNFFLRSGPAGTCCERSSKNPGWSSETCQKSPRLGLGGHFLQRRPVGALKSKVSASSLKTASRCSPASQRIREGSEIRGPSRPRPIVPQLRTYVGALQEGAFCPHPEVGMAGQATKSRPIRDVFVRSLLYDRPFESFDRGRNPEICPVRFWL